MAGRSQGRVVSDGLLMSVLGGKRTLAWRDRRFLSGREEGKLQLLPPGAGGRQQVVTDPPWVAMALKLVRSL